MKVVLKALDRNEDVSILYHGKAKSVLSAVPVKKSAPVAEHPFFNSRTVESVECDRV